MRYTNSEKISESYLAKERDKVKALLDNKDFPFMAEYRERLEDVVNLDDRYEQLRQYVDLYKEISDFLKSEAFTKEVAKYYASQNGWEAEWFFERLLKNHHVAEDGSFTEIQECAVQFYRADFSRLKVWEGTLTLLNNEEFAKDLLAYYLRTPEQVKKICELERHAARILVDFVFTRYPVVKIGCITNLQSIALAVCKKYSIYSHKEFAARFAYWEGWCENNSKLSVAFLRGVMNIPDEELLENVFIMYRESNACHYLSIVNHDPENVYWTREKSRKKTLSADLSLGTSEFFHATDNLASIVMTHRQMNLREADFRQCTAIRGFVPRYFTFMSDTFHPSYLQQEWPEYALPGYVPKNVQDAIYAMDFSLLGTNSLGMINVGDVLKDYLCNFNLTILERIWVTLRYNSRTTLSPSHWGYKKMPEEEVVTGLIAWYKADSKWCDIVRSNDSTAEYIKREQKMREQKEERRRREYEEWLCLVEIVIRDLDRR